MVDWKVSIRGVDMVQEGLGLVADIVLRLKRAALDAETSFSKEARFRFPKESKRFGSTFSESEFSGETARRFRDGAEDGVIATRGQ